MAKYLLLGNTDDSWKLPDETDTAALLAELREGFDGADVVEVEVEMQESGGRLTIYVNPESIGWWSVYEGAEA